ncbi:MAG: uroporphyrinogen decarboxylase/cobalamine-independent methonine synthase family protein [Thermoplasmatota archaeon]
MSPELPLFPLQEIGSLPKTLWRLKALNKEGVDDAALEQAKKEGARLKVAGREGLVTLLEKRTGFAKAEKAEIKRWASRYSLAYLEEAGLDLVYDGEETRTEMYDWPVSHCDGFEDRGWCRSWDHLYFRKAAVVSSPKAKEPYHTAEFLHAKTHARRTLKVPVTGAYTLMDWSFDEHYQVKATGKDAHQRRRQARKAFALDLAKNVLHPTVADLVGHGATHIQVDEPAATTKPDEVKLFVDSFNASVKGLAASGAPQPGKDARFSIHICFSDYRLLFPHILELKGCQEFAPEFANKDSWELGTTRAQRPGYEILHLWKEHGAPFDVGLGVLDVHTDRVEPPELVRDRVLYAASVVGPKHVRVNPDCGLRTRRWPVVQAKLESLVEGTRMARKAWAKVHA